MIQHELKASGLLSIFDTVEPQEIRHRQSIVEVVPRRLRRCIRKILLKSAPPIATSAIAVFVVGCGHSGTTLLASRIGQHSQLHLIPRESNIFHPDRHNAVTHAVVKEWLYQTDLAKLRGFVEKTPKHVHSMGRIWDLLPDARVVGICRNPLDTIASIYRRFGDLNYAIERWLLDNRILFSAKKTKQFHIVRFEDLTQSPEQTLQEICGFVRVPFESGMLREGQTAYDLIEQVENMEIRKQQVSAPIVYKCGTYLTSLTLDQSRAIWGRTVDLADKLGYGQSFAPVQKPQ